MPKDPAKDPSKDPDHVRVAGTDPEPENPTQAATTERSRKKAAASKTWERVEQKVGDDTHVGFQCVTCGAIVWGEDVPDEDDCSVCKK